MTCEAITSTALLLLAVLAMALTDMPPWLAVCLWAIFPLTFLVVACVRHLDETGELNP